MKRLLKNPKILLWLFFIVLSIILIAPNFNPKGIAVTSTTRNEISIGDVVYSLNGADANRDSLIKEYNGVVTVETNHGTKYVSTNGTLGFDGDPVANTNIKFGLDIKGGVRAVLEPNVSTNTTIDQIISTLQTRINVYGLRESVFRPVYYGDKGYIEVSIAGGTKDELKNLIESQGNFEGKIPFVLPVSNGKSVLQLDKNYDIAVGNSSLSVNGNTTNVGDTFSLSGIDFTVNSIDSKSLNLTAKVFSGTDIITIYFDPQRSRIEQLDTGYRWSFGVQLSSAGAQKFAWVTSNVNSKATGYLDAPIAFYLDGKLIDSLNIATSLKGKPETEISISGGANTFKEATDVKTRLQSILRSGALPTKVEIVQLDTISPTLGAGFLKNAAAAGLAAILGVIVVVSIRYRKPKLVFPMLLISLSEVLIVLGISIVIGWTIDLAAIAGIIASVGTGIDSQIIILDRAIRKEDDRIETLKEKLKNAFFVIFGSAGTVIAAMIPLMAVGLGLLRGFAIVTIIGVLVGVLIARPAYGVIIESMTKE